MRMSARLAGGSSRNFSICGLGLLSDLPPLFELAECRRTGSVEEYCNRFQALLPRAGRLDEIQRVQLFMGGLLPPLSHAVRLHNPDTLATAMSLARQVELMEMDR
jgi:hypothetical protein